MNQDFLNELEAHAETVAAVLPSDAQTASIASLVLEAERLRKEIVAAETKLETLQGEYNTCVKKHLPDALEVAGVSKITLKDGITIVEVVSEFHANISEERSVGAFAWLRDHKHDGIIKTKLEVSFGKGDAAKAAALTAVLIERKESFSSKESVHPGTLKAFVKEQKKKEKDMRVKGTPIPEIPDALFGVFEERVAKVTKKSKET